MRFLRNFFLRPEHERPSPESPKELPNQIQASKAAPSATLFQIEKISSPEIPKTSVRTDRAPTTTTRPDVILEQQIARRANEIWKEEGCPIGRELEHWFRAEREVRNC